MGEVGRGEVGGGKVGGQGGGGGGGGIEVVVWGGGSHTTLLFRYSVVRFRMSSGEYYVRKSAIVRTPSI